MKSQKSIAARPCPRLPTNKPWLLLTLLLLRPVHAEAAEPVCLEDYGCHVVIKQGEIAPFDGVLLNRAKLDGVTTELQRCLDKLRLEKAYLASIREAEQTACERALQAQSAEHNRVAALLQSEKEAAQESLLPLTIGAAVVGLLAGGAIAGGVAALIR